MAGRSARLATRLGSATVAILFAATACSSTNTASTGSGGTNGGGGGEGKKIALLLPESKTARYESQDRPLFTAKVQQLCPDCEVIYNNANQDAAVQQSQAEAALTNGANV